MEKPIDMMLKARTLFAQDRHGEQFPRAAVGHVRSRWCRGQL